ncbi:MAG TPA: calcium-binding protein [Rhizobiaceae bacterium]|nr:calcium-binding protein [Rhizobiaceae bacterium]
MALIVKAENDIQAGIRANLGTTDDLFVAAGVTVSRTDAVGPSMVAVYASGSNHIIDIQGSVVNLGDAIQMGDDPSADSGSRILIGEQGYVATYGTGSALDIRSQNTELINRGVISAIGGDGVAFQGGASGTTTILNFGHIEGDFGVLVDNTGETFKLTNSGTIDGGSYAYRGGAGTDHIINTGWITGFVHLGLGTSEDTYDGRSGHLEGGVYGFGGDDYILTGTDHDVIDGGEGNDYMAGGAGDDLYWVDSLGDQVIELAGKGTDTIRSAITLTLKTNIENLVMDTVGNANGTGNAVANVITGGNGINHLKGLAGNDTLVGRDGNDLLTGGLGADRLTGDDHADRFIFNSVAESRAGNGIDKIMDFTRAEGDKIQLSAIDANSTIAGNQAFSFIGKAAFSGKAGQLRYVNNGNDTIVTADINGDRKADFTVISDVAINFFKVDFIL